METTLIPVEVWTTYRQMRSDFDQRTVYVSRLSEVKREVERQLNAENLPESLLDRVIVDSIEILASEVN